MSECCVTEFTVVVRRKDWQDMGLWDMTKRERNQDGLGDIEIEDCRHVKCKCKCNTQLISTP